jgi:hypothetical protein
LGSHPINLAIRFVLELSMLGALGWWGFARDAPIMRWVAAVGLPSLAALLWGVFAVAGDPSRSGQTVVSTPGWIRITIELSLFAAATAALWNLDARRLAPIFATVVFLHYAASYDRLVWLARH